MLVLLLLVCACVLLAMFSLAPTTLSLWLRLCFLCALDTWFLLSALLAVFSVQAELCAAFEASLSIWKGDAFPTFQLAACGDLGKSLIEPLARASPDANETDFQGMFGGRCGWW